MEPCAAQYAAGVTDFAVTLPLPAALGEATDVLRELVGAFRTAVA